MENFKVNPKESLYFGLKAVFSVLVLAVLVLNVPLFFAGAASAVTLVVIVFYAAMIVLFVVFQKIFLIGYLKGNGIRVSANQFPSVFASYTEMGRRLGITKLPSLYLLESGGALNAFATRFSGRNYIAVYSEILSLLETDADALEFILGHELAHVKRNHMSKRFWTLPSALIPFLEAAYSRACELTCDNFGYELVGKRSLNGLVLLSAGKDLYKKIDVEQFLQTAIEDYTAVVKFSGLFASHPYLPRRIRNLKTL